MAKIGIFGCGDIGSRLGIELASNHQVFGVRRHASKIPAPIHPVACDLSQPFDAEQLPFSPEVAYIILTPSARSAQAYRETYIDGTRNILAALGDNTQRLIFVSSSSVYGQQNGQWVDELTPAETEKFNGSILLEAEALVAHRGIENCAVRFAGIYGPGRDRLLNKVRQGSASYLTNPPHYTNRIHVDDCVGFLSHLATLSELATCYIGCDSNPATQQTVYQWLSQQLNSTAPQAVENKDQQQGKRLSNKRMLDSGYNLKYESYESGYQSLIDNIKELQAPK